MLVVPRFLADFFLIDDIYLALQDIDYRCLIGCHLDDYLDLEGTLLLLIHSVVSMVITIKVQRKI